MNRGKKKVFSVLLALVLVAALLPLGSAPAEASGLAPTGLRWEGYTAKWEQAVGWDTLRLYKGGSQIQQITTPTLGSGQQDLSTYITGAGAYTFSIESLSSPAVTSPTLYVYEVSFAPGEHGTGSMSSGIMYDGGSYVLPSNSFTPDANYRFKCWSVGGEEKAEGIPITVTSNTTVTALWQQTCTVSFDANGGSGSMADDTVDVGATYNLPDCGFNPVSGKAFRAWSVDGAEKAVGDPITVTGNTTVIALWKDVCTVSFVPNGGGGSMSDVIVDKGSSFSLPACSFTAPTTSQGFKCWSVGGVEKAVGDAITVNVDTEVKAEWKNIYWVSFAANGGTGTMADVSVDAGEAYTLPGCTFTAPTDKAFKCWLVGGEEKAPGASITPTADTIVTAQWKDTATVTFDPNGGIGTKDPVTQDKGTNYPLPAADTFTPQTGYRFKTWDVNGTEMAPGTVIVLDGNKTVKAIWQETCRVTFNANGGSGAKDPVVLDKGSTYQLPGADTFTAPTGKEFEAWDVNGTAKAADTNITVNADTEVKAKWKNIYYTITLTTPAHGSASVSRATAAYGDTVTVTATPDAGYELSRIVWIPTGGTESDITSTGSFTMPAQDVTVSVIFTEIKYSITKGAKGDWVKNSGVIYEIRVKRSVNDSTTVDHFENLYVNGKLLTKGSTTSGDYYVQNGSIIIKLRPTYLQTLTAKNGYPIKIDFDDGEVSTTFNVLARRGVVTGDTNNLNLWLGVLIVSGALAGGAALLLARRKSKR